MVMIDFENRMNDLNIRDDEPDAESSKDKPRNRINVAVADRRHQLKEVVFYKITGSYEHPEDITGQSILRRYNDFKMLHILLCEQFYYKVLPRLPEKNFLYKLKTSKEMLNNRAANLKRYLNKLLTIDSVSTSDLLKQFLTDQDGFLWMTQTPDNFSVLQKEGLVQSTKSKINTIWNMIVQKDVLEDPGFYAMYAKEIDSLHLFIENTFHKICIVETNLGMLNKDLKSLSSIGQAIKPKVKKDITPADDILEFENEHKQSQPVKEDSQPPFNNSKAYKKPPLSINPLSKISKRLLDLLEDILSCKDSLGRKDKLYQEYALAKNQFKSSNVSWNATDRNSMLSAFKRKAEELERSFKPELAKKIMGVKEQLQEIVTNELEPALINAFSLE